MILSRRDQRRTKEREYTNHAVEKLNRCLQDTISNTVAPPTQWRRQAFQSGCGGRHFIRWKIVGEDTKKQAIKKRYHFITLGVQHSVYLFIHA